MWFIKKIVETYQEFKKLLLHACLIGRFALSVKKFLLKLTFFIV